MVTPPTQAAGGGGMPEGGMPGAGGGAPPGRKRSWGLMEIIARFMDDIYGESVVNQWLIYG